MVRLVLLCDVSEEVPNNTSSDFTVRLSEPLRLEERQWQVGLLSLSLRGAGLRLDELNSSETNHLV